MLIVFEDIKSLTMNLGYDTKINIDKKVLEFLDSIATNICNNITKTAYYISKNKSTTKKEIIFSINIWLNDKEQLRDYAIRSIENDQTPLRLSYKHIKEKYAIEDETALQTMARFIEFIFADLLEQTISNLSSSSYNSSKSSSSRKSSNSNSTINVKLEEVFNTLYNDDEMKFVCGRILGLPHNNLPSKVLQDPIEFYGGSREYFLSGESLRKIGYKVGINKLTDLSCEETRGMVWKYLEKHIKCISYWAKYKEITLIKHSDIQDIYSVLSEYFVYSPDYPNIQEVTLKSKKGDSRLKYYTATKDLLLPIDIVKHHIIKATDNIDKSIKYTKPALKLFQALLEDYLTNIMEKALRISLNRESKQVQPKDFQLVYYISS